MLEEGGPRNAYDTAARMTWDIVARSWEEFPIMQRWFATGEAIAHLRFLEEQGRVTRADDGDLIVYAASARLSSKRSNGRRSSALAAGLLIGLWASRPRRPRNARRRAASGCRRPPASAPRRPASPASGC